MTATLLTGLFNVLLPILVAGLTTFGFERLQQLVGLIEALPAMVKQLIVGASSYLLAFLATALGVHFVGTDITTLNTADLSGLVASGLSFLFHLAVKVKAITPTQRRVL